MTNPPPDLDPAALERLQQWGGPKLLSQMVRLFLENAPPRIDQIRTGVREGAVRDAERGAHSLKSSAANVGATRVSRLAAALEDLASAGDLAGVDAGLDELQAALDAACGHLEGLLDPMTEES